MPELSHDIVVAPTSLATLPAGAGLGLKPQHFDALLEQRPSLSFVEIHAENYMVPGGPLHHYLERIRARYPLSIHGVGLSIGGDDDLDNVHLNRLAQLVDRYQPEAVSEHLAWSSQGGRFANDLLPLAYTPASLQRVCDHIDRVQNVLGRTILLENPATYLRFADSSLQEADFIHRLVQRSGCGLLLDVNNVYVSAVNHGYDAWSYLTALPLARVAELHLAGFDEQQDNSGARLLIDSHGADIAEPVWELYRRVLTRLGPTPTLIERDNNLPSFEALLAEAGRAAQCLQQAAARSPTS